MFQIGEYIVHPTNGAGQISEIVERCIDGVCTEYYKLELPFSGTMLYIPVVGCENKGVRRVCDKAQAEAFLSSLSTLSPTDQSNWNQRNRENLQRLCSGDPRAVAQVVYDLSARARIRPLPSGEKKQLWDARHILESELVIALGCTPAQATARLDAALGLDAALAAR